MTKHPAAREAGELIELILQKYVAKPAPIEDRITATKAIQDELIDHVAALIAVVNNGDNAKAHVDIEIATTRLLSGANYALEAYEDAFGPHHFLEVTEPAGDRVKTLIIFAPPMPKGGRDPFARLRKFFFGGKAS